MLVVEFSTTAAKFLKKADSQVLKRILERIERLGADPFPSEVKRVVNAKVKVFRVRVGDYRILYSVLFEKNVLLIVDIDNRERVYN